MTDYQRLRSHAGLADLQEWSRFELSGPEACDVLDAVVGCNVRDLFEGRATNTLIPSPDGGVEAIVWVIALEEGFRIVGEPADREALRLAIEESASGRDAELRDVREETFALALIGPEAEKVAWKAFGDEVHSIAFLNVLPLGDPPVLAARIGYFGEYELHLFGDAARKQAVIGALEQAGDGDALMVKEGALPVLMTEMGTISRERDVCNHTKSVRDATGILSASERRIRDLREGFLTRNHANPVLIVGEPQEFCPNPQGLR